MGCSCGVILPLTNIMLRFSRRCTRSAWPLWNLRFSGRAISGISQRGGSRDGGGGARLRRTPAGFEFLRWRNGDWTASRSFLPIFGSVFEMGLVLLVTGSVLLVVVLVGLQWGY